MATKIKFTKTHETGNDYIYVDTTRYPIAVLREKAIEWNKFHTGVGSDGLILAGSSDKADFSMCILNADGPEAMMCNNGSYCVSKYVYGYGLIAKKEITLNTRSGIKVLKLHVEGGKVTAVTVDMGNLLETEAVDFDDQFPFQSTRVLVGNPHLVTFVEDTTQINLLEIGSQLGNYHLFSDRTNVEFVQIVGKDTIRMRVWGRGSGVAQAYGTGACATAIAAILHGLAGRRCDTIIDGGTVTIEQKEATGHILTTGSVAKVFDGKMEGQVISTR